MVTQINLKQNRNIPFHWYKVAVGKVADGMAVVVDKVAADTAADEDKVDKVDDADDDPLQTDRSSSVPTSLQLR